ncbi:MULTISPECIES: hypothetical protein [unclassified Sinorhizobium]|nr:MULTISPECIES: hypothetical protein [unclassified Sinorhizobium]MDK1378100.1 hypothetical protein [Sinorhizobium sp. 6-70]MDK1482902.1 hypothetical protein [Sinorhizobium sp. 6-117]
MRELPVAVAAPFRDLENDGANLGRCAPYMSVMSVIGQLQS